MLHTGSIAGDNLVIERLIVGVVETECLQAWLETPVNLGQKQEIRVGLLDGGHGRGPEFGDGCLLITCL